LVALSASTAALSVKLMIELSSWSKIIELITSFRPLIGSTPHGCIQMGSSRGIAADMLVWREAMHRNTQTTNDKYAPVCGREKKGKKKKTAAIRK
jgi:hypothetical protein